MSDREKAKADLKKQRLVADKREKGLVVSSKKGLIAACWDVFGERRSEGAVLNMYKDPRGFPTIGAGHLVMNGEVNLRARYRDRHIERMSKIGIPKEVAAREYDAVDKAMREGKIRTKRVDEADVIVYPKTTPITKEQAKKLFMLDANRHYREALKNFPNLHKYPLELQTLIMHHGYHFGNTDDLKRACGKDLSAENVAMQAAKMRVNTGDYSANTACEVNAAFKTLKLQLPSQLQAQINKNRVTASEYEKNITAEIKRKYARG